MPADDLQTFDDVRLAGRGIGHRFGASVLFRRIDFSFLGGDVIAVTGSNGSGKSTFVRIAAGLLRPSRGDVSLSVDGLAVAHEGRPLRCGMVAPYLNVYEHFSPRENLSFICRARGLDRPDERVDGVLERVNLLDRGNDRVGTFSSGMLQRVRFACALVSDPPVLLLDEPTATLDEEGVSTVHALIDSASRAGRVVVVATNERSEAERCAKRIHIEDFAP